MLNLDNPRKLANFAPENVAVGGVAVFDRLHD